MDELMCPWCGVVVNVWCEGEPGHEEWRWTCAGEVGQGCGGSGPARPTRDEAVASIGDVCAPPDDVHPTSLRAEWARCREYRACAAAAEAALAEERKAHAETRAELRRACTQRQDTAAKADQLHAKVEKLQERIYELEDEGFGDDDPDEDDLGTVPTRKPTGPMNDIEKFGEAARFARECGCPDCSTRGGPVEALATEGWEWRCPSCGGFWLGPAPTAGHPQIKAERCKAVPRG